MPHRARRVRSSAVAVMVAIALGASAAWAAWPIGGLPVGTGPAVQAFRALVPDDAGGVYLVWSNGPGAPNSLQHVDAQGDVVSGWPVNGIALSSYALLSSIPATRDGKGGVYVFHAGPSWVADNDSVYAYGRELYAWRFGSDGLLAPGWTDSGKVIYAERYALNNDVGLKYISFLDAAPDTAGNLLLAMATSQPNSFAAYYEFRRLEDGVPTAVSAMYQGNGGTNALATAPASDGSMIVVRTFQDQASAYSLDPFAVYGVPLTLSDGNAWPSIGDAIRLRPGSDVLLSWTSGTPQQHLLRTDGSLAIAPGWPFGGVPSDFEPLCSDELGGVFARSSAVGGNRIQRLGLASFPPVALWPSDQLPADSGLPLIADGQGGYFQASMTSNGPFAGYTLRALHVDAVGTVPSPWPSTGVVVSHVADFSSQRAFQMVRTEPGAAIIGWTESPDFASDVYLQRLADNAPVPAQVAHVSAEAFTDRVEIEWTIASAAGPLTVERDADERTWSAIGSPAERGRDSWRFEDRDVHAGDVLRYRLSDEGGVLAGSEVSANLPLPPRFALRGFLANPTTLDATVEFTIPDASPARLELLDLAGRVLARCDVGGLGAGTHRVQIGQGLALRPGLVFARLSRSGETKSAKATVLR